jgi:hypothetical protein
MHTNGKIRFFQSNSFHVKILSNHGTAVVIVFSILVQLVLVGKFLDNSIVSAYAPTAMDASDYTNRALLWQSEGFYTAFSDASRMPGYPFVLLILQTLFSSYAYLIIRIIQLLLLAVSAGLIKVVLQRYVPTKFAVTIGGLYAFLPIWHFVPILIGEALTSAITTFIIYFLAKAHDRELSRSTVLCLSLCIALATYTKPNNLLLIVPIFGFLIFSKNAMVIKSMSKIVAIILLLLLPWLIFANNAQPGFVGLTTGSGINSYVGTGMILDYDQGVLSQSAIKWGVDPKSNPSDVIIRPDNATNAEMNSLYSQKSIQIWKKRFWNELGFGLDKIKFAFSISSNSRLDMLIGVFNVMAFLAGLVLLKFRDLRSWAIALLLVILTLALQAVLFQADRRFVIPVLFPFAAVCLGLFLGRAFTRFTYKT